MDRSWKLVPCNPKQTNAYYLERRWVLLNNTSIALRYAIWGNYTALWPENLKKGYWTITYKICQMNSAINIKLGILLPLNNKVKQNVFSNKELFFWQICHSKDDGSCIFCWLVMGRDCVGELGRQYETGLKSHGTVTNWCTGRGWPVNCMTVISARWWSNMPFQRRRKLHIPLASYGKRLSGRKTVI